MSVTVPSPLTPLGADVSKLTIDLHVSTEKGKRCRKRIANTQQGFEQAQQWLLSQGFDRLHVCLEPTGSYSDAFATFMHQAGHRVSMVAPHKMHAFRISEGQLAKTDKIDALLLARYAQQKQPPCWHPIDELHQNVKLAIDRVDQLERMKQQEKNRLENQRLCGQLRESILEHITFLEQQQEKAETCVEDLVQQIAQQQRPDPVVLSQSQPTAGRRRACTSKALGRKKAVGIACVDHFMELKGMGQLTAIRMYSVLSTLQECESAHQLAAYFGVVPHAHQSGTSVNGKAQRRGGNAKARNWLYMAALSSKRFDPDMRIWAKQLEARGLCQKQVIVAVMHKLVRILCGIYKTGQRYDARKAWPGHYPKEATVQAA